jgi:hypothetical protein
MKDRWLKSMYVLSSLGKRKIESISTDTHASSMTASIGENKSSIELNIFITDSQERELVVNINGDSLKKLWDFMKENLEETQS